MTSHLQLGMALLLLAIVPAPAALAQHAARPPGMSHEEHMAQMKKQADLKQHGQMAMGFDQDKAAHHFSLADDGGVIAVAASDAGDHATRDQIRSHLREIALAFGRGDFEKPFLTHGEVPPGVSAMQRLKKEISFAFEESERGGRVRISTANAEALKAVHAFLSYQIKEHGAGGSAPATPATVQEAAHAAAGAGGDHFAHRFEDAKAWAKSFDDPARDEWQLPSRLIAALEIKPEQIVADIGAGTGYFTVRLAALPAKPKVYAVDIEPSMLEHVRHRAAQQALANVTAVQAGPDRTNLPEPVDLVLMVDTYHHIPERVAYFTALKAVLKPGARVAIVDFKKGAPSGPPEEFRLTVEQITGELARAGFTLQKTHDFLPRQMFLVFTVK